MTREEWTKVFDLIDEHYSLNTLTWRQMMRLMGEVNQDLGMDFDWAPKDEKPIPDPNDLVDLAETLKRFDEERESILKALQESKLPLMTLHQIMLDNRDWCRFWVVRYPTEEGRKRFAVELDLVEEQLRIVADKARELLKGREVLQ